MRKYKIAILTESISSNSGARAPVEIAKNLANLGHQIEIFADNFQPQKSTIAGLKSKKVKIHLLKKPRNLFSSRLLPNRELVKALKDHDFDFVLLAAFLPFLFSAKLARRKVIKIYMGTQFRAYLENKNPGEINIFDSLLGKLIDFYIYLSEFTSLHLSNKVVAISKFSGQEATSLYHKKVDKVIYLGGNHLKITPAKNSQSLNLLTVSRITPYKGFHILIEVLKSLKTNKRVTLTIAGKKEKSNYFRYLKKIAPKNVLFVTNPSDKELANLFQTCNLYLSADRYLFFGFPIVEAAFFAKPTLALNYAAAREIIDRNKTGFLFKNQLEMGNKLKKLIKNPGEIKIAGQKAWQKANKFFTWEKVGHQYDLFLNKIYKNKK